MFKYQINQKTGERWASNLIPLSTPKEALVKGKDTWLVKEISKNIDYSNFPEIKDFFIFIQDSEGKMGRHLYFKSKEHGILTSFSWWDNVEQRIKNMTAPLYGTVEQPFTDIDQDWNINIFRKDEYVYLIEGNDNHLEYNTYYKVPIEIYEKEWSNLLESAF